MEYLSIDLNEKYANIQKNYLGLRVYLDIHY